jgi:hypothetical protein
LRLKVGVTGKGKLPAEMNKSTRIVGIVLLAFLVLQMASMHHWGEVFAWIIALGVWYMACLQQSCIDEAQRKIEELQKQLGSRCGDLIQVAKNLSSDHVALPAKSGAAMSAPPEMPMELIVATFLRTVPTCLRIVREETIGTAEIPDATIANITVALFLFFLPDYVPYSDQENIYKMRRAFQTSWLAIHNVSGDEGGAREWFDLLNCGMAASEPPLNRIAIAIAALKTKFPGHSDDESALDVLVYSVWSSMKTINSFVIT